jgi:hypothetical protein
MRSVKPPSFSNASDWAAIWLSSKLQASAMMTRTVLVAMSGQVDEVDSVNMGPCPMGRNHWLP